MTGVRTITVWEEHQFWLAIIQDHAIFLRDALSPLETEWIRQAEYYIAGFESLQIQLNGLDRNASVHSESMVQFAQACFQTAHGYFLLEGHIQALRIYNEVVVSLLPTYFNGTLNENQEYLRLLQAYRNGMEPEPLAFQSLIDLWLEDQLGHALLLIHNLDSTEALMIRRVQELQSVFSALMVKQRQFQRYLRFAKPGFPAELTFAYEIAQAVKQFTALVKEIVARYQHDQIINSFTLRFIEHHFPEACYFLIKLQRFVPAVSTEHCSLVKPSFTS